MPDAARIAQAQALEVPIILQGAKTADESGHRELFKENATTTLVFENGAVLHLRAKLAVGQTVFIHNTQNGREILCKVLEAPGEGELGLTDLEFTTAAPDFWDANSHVGAQPSDSGAQNSTAANEQPESHVPSDVPGDDPLAMMLETASKIDVPSMTKPGTDSGGPLREELMPAHEMAPDPSGAAAPVPDFEPAATANSPASEPSGEQIDAALKQMSGAARAASPLAGSDAVAPAGADADHAQDEKHIAALMERDARLAKFAAFKEKQAEKIQKDAAAKDAAKGPAKEGPERAKELEGASEPRPFQAKAGLVEMLTTGKNATYVTIAAAVLIAVAGGFIWHAMRGAFVSDNDQPTASAPAQPKSASPAPANPATPGPTTEGASAPAAVAAPAASATRKTRTVSERSETAHASEAEGATSAAGDEVASNADATASKHRGSAEANNGAIVPARVLSQPQPTLPPWAVDVQVDGVVTLDVTVDEKGNVSETKVLAGPRPLQREAERAVGLWQFAPARSGGKPTSAHLTLSVEFLPPPPPKRFP
jgi:TonB family protein